MFDHNIMFYLIVRKTIKWDVTGDNLSYIFN